jgi:hypothetical protein
LGLGKRIRDPASDHNDDNHYDDNHYDDNHYDGCADYHDHCADDHNYFYDLYNLYNLNNDHYCVALNISPCLT